MDDKMDDNDWSDNSEPPRKHVKHNSTCYDAEPTQLCLYPSTQVDILECAKQYFCLQVNECQFAKCEVNLSDVQHSPKQAMDEFKDKDIEVEPGKVQTIPSNNLT